MSPALSEAIAGIKRAFGAPGDHGYGTKEGDALFALYKAAAEEKVGLDDDMVVRAMEHIPGCDHDDMVSALEAALGLPSSKAKSAA